MTSEQKKQVGEIYNRWLWVVPNKDKKPLTVVDALHEAFELGLRSATETAAVQPVQSIVDHSECFIGMLDNE